MIPTPHSSALALLAQHTAYCIQNPERTTVLHLTANEYQNLIGKNIEFVTAMDRHKNSFSTGDQLTADAILNRYARELELTVRGAGQ